MRIGKANKVVETFRIIALVALMLMSVSAAGADDNGVSALEQWRAGEQVSPESVERFGVGRCFKAEPISDKVFARMWKKSYKEYCTVPRASLRYLKVLHYTAEGTIKLGEMVCDKAIAAELIGIFRELYEARYPIERMVLVDDYGADDELSMKDNNTSCFNFRYVTGTKKLSNHSRGLAVDINPLYNPCVKVRADGTIHVEPSSGRAYADRSKAFVHKIDRSDLCYRLFTQHGFKWGGGWRRTKDYQHFEKSLK